MWSYGEVFLPLPHTSRRIDIREGSAPAEQVQYTQKCNGLELDNGSTLIWRNDAHKLELIQFHPEDDSLSDSITIFFPRNVQVLPTVAMKETKNGVSVVVASQASVHLIQLHQTPHHSLLSDLTSSSFKRCYFSYKTPVAVTSCHSAMHDQKGLLIFASKQSSPTVICLSASESLPEIHELKSTGLLGRLWNSQSESSRSKCLQFGLANGHMVMISITGDHQLRVWAATGECLYTALIPELQEFEGNLELQVTGEADGFILFILAGSVIYKYRLTNEGKKDQLLVLQEICAPVDSKIVDFNSHSPNLWTVMKEETEDGEMILVKAFSQDRWVDIAPSQPAQDYLNCMSFEEIPRMLLQESTIMPSALRRALNGKAHDSLPDQITTKFLTGFLTNEARHEGISQEEYFAEFYQTVLEYNERATAVCGIVGGQKGQPMVLRRNVVSFIRPLTQIEAICGGLDPEHIGTLVSGELCVLLSSVVPLFNDIVANSDVMELFSYRLRLGEHPLLISDELKDEVKQLVVDSERSNDLDNQIRNLVDDLKRIGGDLPVSGLFYNLIHELSNHIEITSFSEDIDLESSPGGAVDAGRFHLLSSIVRSVGFNLFTLSELLLLLVDYLIGTHEYTELLSSREKISNIVSNFVTLDWISSAQSVNKARLTRSDLTLSSSRLGESTFSMTTSTLFDSPVPTETQLLEVWLATGSGQAETIETQSNLEPLSAPHNEVLARVAATIKLLSISNNLMGLPIYLLETNQYDLLAKWVRLNKYVSEPTKAVVNYFEGICLMQNQNIPDAIHCFMTCTTNLVQDFFLGYLLKNDGRREQALLTTSMYIHLMEKFKDNTEFCREIAEIAVGQIDQDDQRQSLLWNKLFLLRLDAEDYDGAYHAMISNPNKDRQRDCLRKFVLHLSDRGDLAPLVNSEYHGLESEIAPILENRALAVSSDDTGYFDLLFAFHFARDNYRQAARAMYLQSLHIGTGFESLERLETREAALLTAINTLHLAQDENQWVATAPTGPHRMKSPKRSHEGDFMMPLSKDTVVTSLEDMEKELLLTQARLTLKMENIDTAGLYSTEIASLLSKEGLYVEAAALLKAFDMEADVPVKILASTYACNISRPDADSLEIQLTELLEEFELRSGSSRLYYIAAEEILKIGQMLPQKFMDSYKSRDVAEFIRQMAKFGEVGEAVDGACELLDSVASRMNRRRKVDDQWLPTSVIEELNYFTKLHNHELHERLQGKMSNFLDVLEKTVRTNFATSA